MGYRTQSSDTNRAVEERQTAYFQRLGLNGRLACGAQVMDEGFASLWSQLRRDFPDMSQQQLKVEWVRRHYGAELAQRYEKHLSWKSKISDSNAP